MITALAAFPIVVGAQMMDPTTDPTPEGRSTEGYLIPEGAQPRETTLEAVPPQNLVRDAQLALRDAGFDPGRIDGVMGPRTQSALREFQASYGLPQTGRLDATTQERLLAEAPATSGRR
jgi:peptidoglycan hydrolase-like protein with peptidoglycan-binding domain